MRTKFLGLLLLALLALAWVLVLLYVPPLSWQSYVPARIALVFIVPPLAIWLAVLFSVRHKKLHALQAKEASQAAEREAQREATKKQYRQEVSERRLCCDCRGLVVLGSATEKFENVFPPLEQANLRNTPPHVSSEQDFNDISETALQWRAMLVSALPALYQQVPAAVLFPIYILLPNDVVYRDELGCIEHLAKLQMQAFAEALPNPPRMPPPIVMALPNANHPADSLIGIFEQNPELAGIVTLIFDSPLSRPSPLNEPSERPAVQGLPQQGLIAMCLTNAKLDEIVTAIARFEPEENHGSPELQPCWEKRDRPSGYLALLVPLERQERQALLSSEILAVIHRSATAETAPKLRPAQLAGALQSLLERTLITSGQNAYPFDFGELPKDQVEALQSTHPAGIGWLVHNSGTLTSPQTGGRLGALGRVLQHFQFDLNLVEEASNLTQTLGDWGQATAWAMLASSIAHTAEKQEPTLMTLFGENHQVAMVMTRPSQPTRTDEPED